MEDVGAIVTDVRGTVENVGAIVTDVRATVDTTLATVDTTLVAVRQGIAGTQASVAEITRGVMKGTESGIPSPRCSAPLTSPRRWGTTRGRWWAGHCWQAICLGAWVVATRCCGWLPKEPPRRRGPHDLEAPPHSARLVRSSTAGQPGIVSGILDQVKDEMKDEIASLTKRRCWSRDKHTP